MRDGECRRTATHRLRGFLRSSAQGGEDALSLPPGSALSLRTSRIRASPRRPSTPEAPSLLPPPLAFWSPSCTWEARFLSPLRSAPTKFPHWVPQFPRLALLRGRRGASDPHPSGRAGRMPPRLERAECKQHTQRAKPFSTASQTRGCRSCAISSPCSTRTRQTS